MYEYISQRRDRWPVKELCRVLQVSESGYYRSLKQSERSTRRQLLLVKIKEIINEFPDNENYGAHRVHLALRQQGDEISYIHLNVHWVDVVAERTVRGYVDNLPPKPLYQWGIFAHWVYNDNAVFGREEYVYQLTLGGKTLTRTSRTKVQAVRVFVKRNFSRRGKSRPQRLAVRLNVDTGM